MDLNLRNRIAFILRTKFDSQGNELTWRDLNEAAEAVILELDLEEKLELAWMYEELTS